MKLIKTSMYRLQMKVYFYGVKGEHEKAFNFYLANALWEEET
jgi:hypothetical protein